MNTPQQNNKKFIFPLVPGDRIFLYGIPGAGKTTFAQELIRSYMQNPDLVVLSPTYTYYQKYWDTLYHFDLYRAETIEDIIRIGADEILENPDNICLIEWPEILEKVILPTRKIKIHMHDNQRVFEIFDVKSEELTR